MRFGGIFVGVLMAAGAAFFVLQSGSEPAPPPIPAPVAAQAPEVKAVNVYVAKNYIPIGTVITNDMLDVQPWPEHLLVPGFAVADGSNEIAGMVTRAPFQPQEPFIKTKLVNANDPSFIAGSLPKGMRAITIETNEIFGLAGFLAAGDRVDVLLNRETEDKVYLDPTVRAEPRRFKITENILNNVRVIAVDQKAQAVDQPEAGLAPRQPQRYEPPRSVSLMVSAEDARRLRLAESIGTLSLALRSVDDRDVADTQSLTMVADVSQFTPQEVPAEPKPAEEEQKIIAKHANLVTVVRGIEVEDKQTKKRQLDLDEQIASFSGAGTRRQ
jgi:pilus assembly protein CpaB